MVKDLGLGFFWLVQASRATRNRLDRPNHRVGAMIAPVVAGGKQGMHDARASI